MKLELINGLTQLQSLKNVSIAFPYFRPSSILKAAQTLQILVEVWQPTATAHMPIDQYASF